MDKIMEKINVGLYGGKGIFGGKETPLTAKIVYCDKCKSCELYKENKCLNVTAPFSASCKYGQVQSIKGYTSRAAKYSDFRSKYKNDDKYNKLSYPQDFSFVEIGDYYVVNIAYTHIFYKEESDYHYYRKGWNIDTPFIGTSVSFIPKEEFNLELLIKIVNYVPKDFNYKSIRNDKSVNNFLVEVSKKLPNLYNEFIKEYPQYKDIKTNYVGRYAFINTMVDGSELIDPHKNKFILKNGYLYCDNYRLSFLPFNSKVGELKIKVTDEMTYKITDNNQVDENTKYV